MASLTALVHKWSTRSLIISLVLSSGGSRCLTCAVLLGKLTGTVIGGRFVTHTVLLGGGLGAEGLTRILSITFFFLARIDHGDSDKLLACYRAYRNRRNYGIMKDNRTVYRPISGNGLDCGTVYRLGFDGCNASLDEAVGLRPRPPHRQHHEPPFALHYRLLHDVRGDRQQHGLRSVTC